MYCPWYIMIYRMKQRRYVEDEEALAQSGAFTLSNPLVAVKDEGMLSCTYIYYT